MDKLRIVGGQRLQGAVTISGAKNAALPQIAASLLSAHPLELTNLPAVTDVDNMLGVVTLHGAAVERSARGAIIDTSGAVSKETSYDTVRKMRATVLVLGPLLARFGHARVSLPGGCAIGARPVDMHVKALAALGADIGVENGLIVANAPQGLAGARIVLASPSVGATETAMMAATAAKGETEILNAAREPEVADLAACTASSSRATRRGGRRRTRSFPTASRRAPTRSRLPSPEANWNSPMPGSSIWPRSCRCWKRRASACGRATAA
jgi:UDP-N-acetylglucosamine 1-carboxyvinyltransferase